MSALELIAAERNRQREHEGWTPAHDDEHDDAEIAWAAACYAAPEKIFAYVRRYQPCSCREATCEHMGGEIRKRLPCDPWPWAEEWDKRQKHDRVRQLVIAGALIAAEIDRLERAAQQTREGSEPGE